jgi:hypothetical protein
MRNLMVLAAVAALMLVAASPAFAQAVAIDQGDDTEFNAVAQNIAGPVGAVTQTQVGTTTSTATGDSAASASVTQTQDFSFSQSNEALNGFSWWGWWWF